jgi:hypothetical protein
MRAGLGRLVLASQSEVAGTVRPTAPTRARARVRFVLGSNDSQVTTARRFDGSSSALVALDQAEEDARRADVLLGKRRELRARFGFDQTLLGSVKHALARAARTLVA